MLLDTILENLKKYPDVICCKHDRYYTNREFYEIVCKVYICIKDAPRNRPIVVYGHKEVYMIASFLACSFLGIAYVPADIMLGETRINQIINITNPSYIIGDFKSDIIPSISFEEIERVNPYEIISTIKMNKDDLYYIIFTSGSTGIPKGVMITYENIDSCVNWLANISNIEKNNDYVIYNQAVFSFDLSVADIYLSLYTNSIHYIGNDVDVLKLKDKISDLRNSNANMLVVTPSTAEVYCLSEQFNDKLMPKLEKIILCGETLSKRLVDELYFRFRNVIVLNMYGPTECTFAVTSTKISVDYEEIPIGKPKTDVEIIIVDDNLIEQTDEKVGEILISGKSVAKGYLNVSNANKFIEYNGKKAYLTGDLGYYKNGQLYYVSRKDSQIKYKGYRIELSDIENTIGNTLGIKDVKVTAVKDSFGVVQRIEASVILENDVSKEKILSDIKKNLPSYMVPRVKFLDYFEININGKKSRN